MRLTISTGALTMKITSFTAGILIIDSDEVLARGIKSALLSRGCSEVYYSLSRSEALLAVKNRSFDLALISHGIEDEFQMIADFQRLAPDTSIAILADETSWALAQEMEHSRVGALMSKRLPISTIVDSLNQLLANPAGFIYIGERETSVHLSRLTLSEKSVLTYLAQGLTTREIARTRHNSEATIKSHLTSIYRKLEARNRIEAVAHLRR